MLELMYYGMLAILKERAAANPNIAVNWDVKSQPFHDRGDVFILLKGS